MRPQISSDKNNRDFGKFWQRRWRRRDLVKAYSLLTASFCIIIAGFSMLGSSVSSHGDGGLPFLGYFLLGLVVAFLVAIPLMAYVVVGTIGRLKDIGASPYLAVLALVPALGMLQAIYLCLAPGNEGANEYGPDPRNRTS